MSQVVFDPFSDDFFNNPYATYRRMRDEAPVYYNDIYDFYALTRHADVTAALKDTATFSSSRGIDLQMVKSGEPPPPLIIMMDPPEHRRMRSLVNKVFTPRAIERQRQTVMTQIDRYLSAADPDNFDVVQDFSALFPVEVITQMLGVPPELRQQVRLLLDKSLEREYGKIEMPEAGMAAAIETGLMYFNIIQERRAEPQDDMISSLFEVYDTQLPVVVGDAFAEIDRQRKLLAVALARPQLLNLRGGDLGDHIGQLIAARTGQRDGAEDMLIKHPGAP